MIGTQTIKVIVDVTLPSKHNMHNKIQVLLSWNTVRTALEKHVTMK
jgi:hypothetical protein